MFEGRERRLVIGKEDKVKQSYIVTFLMFLLTILAGTPLSWIKGIGRLFEGLGENSKYGQIYFMLKHLLFTRNIIFKLILQTFWHQNLYSFLAWGCGTKTF